jgi:EF-hand domain pair
VNVSGDIREDKVRFAFELFDLDGSGFIDASELRKIVRATNLASEKQLDRKVRWLLSQCDKNGDGRIRCGFAAFFDCKPTIDSSHSCSYEEFQGLARKFPNLVFPAFSLASSVQNIAGPPPGR